MPFILPSLAGVGGSSLLSNVATGAGIFGSAVSGLGSLFGGGDSGGLEPIQAERLNRSAKRSAINQSRASYRRELRESRRVFKQNVKLQKEFAQNAIQWRVRDARKAGLHPLFALGGSGASYSPTVAIPASSTPSYERVYPSGGGSYGPDYVGLGNAMSSMGQNLQDLVTPQLSGFERAMQQYDLALKQSQLANDASLRQVYASEIARNSQAQMASRRPHHGGPYGLPGYGDSWGGSKPIKRYVEPVLMPDGTIQMLPSTEYGLQAAESSEDAISALMNLVAATWANLATGVGYSPLKNVENLAKRIPRPNVKPYAEVERLLHQYE